MMRVAVIHPATENRKMEVLLIRNRTGTPKTDVVFLIVECKLSCSLPLGNMCSVLPIIC